MRAFGSGTALLLAFALAADAAGARRNVSFWYAPDSYGGTDIAPTLSLLKNNSGVVSSLMIYCGTTVGTGGTIVGDSKTAALCLGTSGGDAAPPPLIPGLKTIGVNPEIVLNGGASNVSDYRLLFANNATTIPALVAAAKSFGAVGINLDLEPQVGSPASTPADALAYATYCAELRKALNAEGIRLTIAVADWSPMLSNFAALAPAVDRLMSMETYNADSMAGWLAGDAYGGHYNHLVAPGVPRQHVAPGLGCWAATCGGSKPCWSTTPASGTERMNRIIADDMPEVAMFRIVQVPSSPMPQPWWWPLLKKFAEAPMSSRK